MTIEEQCHVHFRHFTLASLQKAWATFPQSRDAPEITWGGVCIETPSIILLGTHLHDSFGKSFERIVAVIDVPNGVLLDESQQPDWTAVRWAWLIGSRVFSEDGASRIVTADDPLAWT